MKKFNIFIGIIVVLFLLLPELGVACPLCQGGQSISKKTIFAYKAVTAFLALLPIIGCSSIFYWIYRKTSK